MKMRTRSTLSSEDSRAEKIDKAEKKERKVAKKMLPQRSGESSVIHEATGDAKSNVEATEKSESTKDIEEDAQSLEQETEVEGGNSSLHFSKHEPKNIIEIEECKSVEQESGLTDNVEKVAKCSEPFEENDAEERSDAKLEIASRRQDIVWETQPEASIASDVLPFPEMMHPFPANSTSIFSGQFDSEIAKNFYNSINLLTSQAMMGLKQNSPENGHPTPSESTKTPCDGKRQISARNASQSSSASGRSYDDVPSSENRRSPTPCSQTQILQRPLSGISPRALAEQLRNNDSASMVVSRQQQFTGRHQDYSRAPYSDSDGESPSAAESAFHASSSGGHLTASLLSSSLHHFTTRYTIEMPSDPSRLGVELMLEHDNDEPVIEVECGGNRGLLYANKLCQGSKGQCIHFNDEWLTPNEFQFVSGRVTAKDWKRSIRHCGKSLKTLMTKGILQVHLPVCECNQCRGLHAGSKFAGKKMPQKDGINNRIPRRTKSSSSFDYTRDGNPSHADHMARFESGGLSSVISQLRMANGLELSDSSGSFARGRDETTPSPQAMSRKRSRDKSPETMKRGEDSDGGGSPSVKRPRSRQGDDYRHGPAFFSAFSSAEDQYRRMLAMMSSPLSHEKQQRHFPSLADSTGVQARDLADFSAFLNSPHLNDRQNKTRYGARHDFDLSIKASGRKEDYKNSAKRSGHGFRFTDKHQKPDHRLAEQKYIALGSRHGGDRAPRDDVRSWTANRHASMIDVNSSGLSHGWPHRSLDRINTSGQRQEKMMSPRRNGNGGEFFQDNFALDRIPITKAPVTTLHHRPAADCSPESELRRRHPRELNDSSRSHDHAGKEAATSGPRKHAIPLLALQRPTEEDLLHSSGGHGSRTRLSNDADQEMDRVSKDGPPIRQTASAPPPNVLPDEANREIQQSTFAQDRLLVPGNGTTSPMTSPRRPTPFYVGDFTKTTLPCESYLQRRDNEIKLAFDEMQQWTVDDVCNFLKEIEPDLLDQIELFRKHEVDGEGLPFLTDQHLMNMMDIKLGRALKIVSRVRRTLTVLPNSVTRCNHQSFIGSAAKSCSLENPTISENGRYAPSNQNCRSKKAT